VHNISFRPPMTVGSLSHVWLPSGSRRSCRASCRYLGRC
jgi:hypothetical protein